MSLNDRRETLHSDINLTELESYDSCMYGKFQRADNEQKHLLLKKGISYYEKASLHCNSEPDLYCKLGHLHLLLEDYHKALSAYNKYYLLKKDDHWKDSPFLYGLGIVCYHFSAYIWAVKLFQQLLYNHPGFCRANEVHCRLGLIYKLTGNHSAALKHFYRFLSDCRSCSISKPEIHFHVGHLFEIQHKYSEARKEYERIISLPATQVKPFVQANTLRQLGWMFHTVQEFGNVASRTTVALQFLQRSIEIDPNNGQTWYFLGRYYSSMGKVHDAFVSYRQSIDKSEASADTWCSIGVLYQEQNQPMDALQAYICAVQLDRSHEAAWRDLAVLYEACQQPKDALVCYLNAQHCLNVKHKHVQKEDLTKRIKALQEQVGLAEADSSNKAKILPCIEEAWTLPIPAELAQRQSAFKCPLAQQKRQHSSNQYDSSSNPTGVNASHSLHTPCSSTSATDPAGLPGTSIETTNAETSMEESGKSCAKRKKLDVPSDLQPPAWYLTTQQLQVLQNLRLNRSILTNHQLIELERLEHNFSIMSHHQKSLKDELANQFPNSVSRSITNCSVPAATSISALPGNVSAGPLVGKNTNAHSSATSGVETGEQHFNLPENLAEHVPVPNTLLVNGDKEENCVSVQAQKESVLKEQKATSSVVEPYLVNGVLANSTYPPSVKPLNTTFTSSTSGLTQPVTNGRKEFIVEEVKGKPVVQDSALGDKHSEEGKYNSVMDTPQDTPSSDSGLVTTVSAQPLQLQAKLVNHVEQLTTCSGTNKASPASSLNFRHSGLDGVLSPPGTIINTEQLCTKTEGLESHCCDNSDEINTFEKDVYAFSSIEGRALPPLLRPIGIPETLSAREVITTCRKLTCNGTTAKHLFLDKCPPPAPPKCHTHVIPREELSPPAPTIFLENKKEAMSRALADFCTNPKNPVTVIRGLAAALKLDLGLFSTKTLVESNPECTVEVRTQLQQPSEENWDAAGCTKVWLCESNRSYTSIAKYATYQAATFHESLQEEELKRQNHGSSSSGDVTAQSKNSTNYSLKSSTSNTKRKSFKTIKFGTNIDLSNEKKWRLQLQELSKLPWLFRLVSAGNMLSHVGHNILGMNTIQLYMKVPGSRTPGHQENNNYSAININIGPGDCEWFAVPEEYWGEIHTLCEKHNINYLSGSWWPVLEDLYQANIPVYRFIQKPGDMVWLNAGTVHWVQAVGWCNNIAWNVGLVSAYQYQMAIERYEWNKLNGYKSIVPLLQLTWNMAQHVRVTDAKLFRMMKTCMMRTLWQCQQILDNLKRNNIEVTWHGRNETDHSHYCEACEVELFNLLFVRRSDNLQTHLVYCEACARNCSADLENFVVLNQYHTDELMRIYDQFSLSKTTKT